MNTKLELDEDVSELHYESDCLSKEFLEDLLREVYTRSISIEQAVEIILDDVVYLKRNLIKG